MTPSAAPAASRRTRLWAAGIAIAIAVAVLAWSAAGFLLLPWLAKRELPRVAEEQMQLRLRIGDVAFNPFTLALSVSGLAVEDRAGKPLLALAGGTVALEWRSLLRRAWVLSDLRLDTLSVHAVIDAAGRLNLAALLPPQRADASGGLPRFALGSLSLRNGSVAFEDLRAGYRNRMEQLSLDLNALTTLSAEPGGYALGAQLASGAKLRWKGELALAPLAASGTLAVDGVALADLTPYLDEFAAARITSGSADLELPYRLTLTDGRPELRLAGAKLAARDVAIAAKDATAPFAAIGGLQLEGVDVDLGPRRLAARLLRVNALRLDAQRGADGSIDLARLVLTRPGAPPAGGPAPAWQAELAAIEIDGASANFVDASAKVPVAIAARGLTLRAKLAAASGQDGVRVQLEAPELGLGSLEAGKAGQPGSGASSAPAAVKLAGLSLGSLRLDSAARTLDVATLAVASVGVDAAMRGGRLDLLDFLPGGPTAASAPWHAGIGALTVNGGSLDFVDDSAKVPVAFALRGLKLRARVAAGPGRDGMRVRVDVPESSFETLQAGPAGAPATVAVKVAGVSAASTQFDSGAHSLDVATLRIASLGVASSLRDGHFALLDLLPGSAGASDATPAVAGAKRAGAAASPATPTMAAHIKSVELADGNLSLRDEGTGATLGLDGLTAKLRDLTSEALTSSKAKPMAFEFAAAVRSGGRLTARGQAVPAAGSADATVEAAGIALAPLQPYLARFTSARLASGEASLAGKLQAGGKDAKLVFNGSASLANMALKDPLGTPLVAWKTLGARSLRLSLSPDRLDIDELRLASPAAVLAIAKDGSSNLSRVFSDKAPPAAGPRGNATTAADATATTAKGAAPAPVAASTPPAAGMAVLVRRLRMDDGVLEFSDENISPGFTTRMHELAGTADALSSDRDTRSQFLFEGRIEEFGYARLSGSINAFAPRDRTTFRVQMRNVDLTRATPYSMRFAGYRIATGRLSLDVNYRVRDGAIEGDNQFTLEQFTLGERVDSPDALKLPLELAVAMLKDADGRIVLDLPIRGSLDDPQFSIAPLVWKAIGNLVGSILTAPFRALAGLFGAGKSGEDVGIIAFETGASRLLPPEREKIIQVAGMLAKRPELKLVIPARFDSGVDPEALRRAAFARDLGRRAGYEVRDEDAAGPVNTRDRPTREALRALFTERFSAAELARLKAEAEAKYAAAAKSAAAGTPQPKAPAQSDAPADAEAAGTARISLLDRVRNLAAGEPQVADSREFYATLVRRLRDAQPLPADALPALARRRGEAIEAALRAAGATPERLTVNVVAPAANAAAKQVSVALSLSAR